MRGTVQADILKEDQAQNTCIFSTEFSLERWATCRSTSSRHAVRNFYSVSISGYHMAEAGANPITQLAFTLANGFTYVRVLPGARPAGGRVRAQLVVLLQQRTRSGVRGARPRGAAHLGDRDARALRRGGAQPEAEVSHPDFGPVAARAGDVVQRRAHDPAGAGRAGRLLQQPAYQRLRRGRDDADRGVGAPGARDPAGPIREFGLLRGENLWQGSYCRGG